MGTSSGAHRWRTRRPASAAASPTWRVWSRFWRNKRAMILAKIVTRRPAGRETPIQIHRIRACWVPSIVRRYRLCQQPETQPFYTNRVHPSNALIMWARNQCVVPSASSCVNAISYSYPSGAIVRPNHYLTTFQPMAS